MYTTEEPEDDDEGFKFIITDPKILVGVICGVTFVLASITIAICCSMGGGRRPKKKRRGPPPKQQAYIIPLQGSGPNQPNQPTILVVSNNNNHQVPAVVHTLTPSAPQQPQQRPGPSQTTARAMSNQGHRPSPRTGKKHKKKEKDTRMNRLENKPKTYDNNYIKFEVPAPADRHGQKSNVQVDDKLSEISEFFTRAFKKVLEAISIPPERIHREDVLGSGQFGVVYKGVMTNEDQTKKTDVALKTVTGDANDESDIQEFMAEILRMKHFSHPHVMPLLGMTIMAQKPYIVMPYMANGDLKGYLSDSNRILTVEDLLKMALQVTRGMEYLAGQNIIHGDLAARNCMVSEEESVMVSDFGLSRHLFQSDYYSPSDTETLRPYRWMAYESLEDHKFTIKSDVWSFGILLWEIMTRGQRPYPDIKTNCEVGIQLKKGYRMPCPEYCAIEIHKMMMKCWDTDSHNRPNFKDITSTLDELLQEAGGDYEKPIASQSKTKL